MVEDRSIQSSHQTLHVDGHRIDLTNAQIQAVLILAGYADDIALHKSVSIAHFADGANVDCTVVLSGVRLHLHFEVLLVC